MIRVLFAVPLLLLVAAAPDTGPISLAPVQLAMASVHLLPEPAAAAPGALQPAPMPDAQSGAPSAIADQDGSPQLAPKLYRQHEQFGGDGFANGSSVQNAQQRERPALGLGIAVPVD